MATPPEQTRIWRIKPLDNILTMRACFHRFAFSNHFHDDYAIGLVAAGAQAFTIRGTTYHVPAGSIFTVNPGEVHDGRSDSGHGYRYAALFVPAALVAEIHATGSTCPLFGSPVTSEPRASLLLSSLIAALDDSDTGALELQDGFFSLLSHLFATHSHRRLQQVHDHPAIRRGCQFINDMAAEPINLEDMARAAGLSRFHFLRLFKQQTGMSPGTFLQNRRLHLARSALERGVRIGDAAVTSGFFDQSHLNRRFKAAFGLTPRQFQQALRS